MDGCVFCRIVELSTPAEIINQNRELTVFKDVNPKAPHHFLIVPNRHIESVNQLENSDLELAGRLVLEAQDVSKKLNLQNYKIQINVGKKAGQVIDHLHLHFLAD